MAIIWFWLRYERLRLIRQAVLHSARQTTPEDAEPPFDDVPLDDEAPFDEPLLHSTRQEEDGTQSTNV